MWNTQIIGEQRIADQIGDHREGEGGDDDRHGGKAVQPVGQVHGVAGPDDHGRREQDVEKPKLQPGVLRSEEHTSELQSLMRIPYAVFCLKNKKEQPYAQISDMKKIP